MDLLFRTVDRAFHRQVLAAGAHFEPPFAGRAYPCLLWDHGAEWASEARCDLARALIRSNCRYVVCAGAECEVWHDTVDEVFVSEYLDQPEIVQDERHVMTTWHEDEPVDDVAFFFVLNTNFDDHEFADYLVLHIGGEPKAWHLVEDAIRHVELREAAG